MSLWKTRSFWKSPAFWSPPSFWKSLCEQWSPRLYRERHLLIELALMLLVALVVGVYFLEHFSTRLEAQQRGQLQALAEQTALRAAESLAGSDLIGLNVIARETQALDTVSGVRFLDTSRKVVVSNGDAAQALSVEVPVALPGGDLAGSVVLFASPAGGMQTPLRLGFILVVAGLLILRVAAALIERRLRRSASPEDGPAGDGDEQREVTVTVSGQPSAPPVRTTECDLWLSVVNFSHFQQRYTRSALQALLADYRELLQQVADLYGGVVEQDIGDRCRVRFSGESLSQASFSALCAGLLFLRVVRLQGPRRKSRAAPALEFKALVSSQFDDAEGWALCVVGVPGRLHVPDTDLVRAELDVKALYQTEKSMAVRAGDRQVRLQPVEQLAHRYQALLRTQAERVMGAGLGDSGDEGAELPSR